MPVRKPVNGCMISVDLRKGKLLGTSRKVKQAFRHPFACRECREDMAMRGSQSALRFSGGS